VIDRGIGDSRTLKEVLLKIESSNEDVVGAILSHEIAD